MGMPVGVLQERLSVLTGLMVVQSLSGIILGAYLRSLARMRVPLQA